MDFTNLTKQCLPQKTDDLASIAIVERGFPSPSSEIYRHDHHLISRHLHSPGTTSFRSLNSFSSPRSGMFINGRFQEQQPHFLDACFLCKKPLGCNRDIFMYRGNVPFCSEECRGEQIEIDESKEKKRNLSATMKAMKKKEERNKSSSSSPKYPFHSGAVAAA